MLVHDEGLPRGFWKIAQVQEVLAGRDGNIRGAVVRVSAWNRRPILLRRPVQRLYPLEGKSLEIQEPTTAGAEDWRQHHADV